MDGNLEGGIHCPNEHLPRMPHHLRTDTVTMVWCWFYHTLRPRPVQHSWDNWNRQDASGTAVFGIFKLTAAVVCALFLIEFNSRKRSLLIGITLQAVSMIYVAVFLTAVPELGIQEGYLLSPSQSGLSKGAIAMIYISGFGWALGWNSMQYLLTAELFPLRIRAFCTSLAMSFHFANQYGNTWAVPNMLLQLELGGISPKGTFWSFAIVTILGAVWVFFMVPETAGRSLESMDSLFSLPWYKIGRYGNRNADLGDLEPPQVGEENVITGKAMTDEVEKK